ncbi:MAG: site-specific integrase [Elusimicrobia bacterium]|nr:site-specific integrase [Elusimicrobiota bacterium]
MKAIFNWAIKNEKATDNPVRKVKLLRENNTRVRFLSLEEINRLLDACPIGIKPIVITAILTGMRRGELLSLKWEDVNSNQKIIFVRKAKSGYSRDIPICLTLEKVLLNCYNNSNGVYVFCSGKKEPYKKIDTIFGNAVKRAKIVDFHFHDLRHTAAAYMVMSGMDLTTVKEILGHRSIKMTMRYAHLSPHHKRTAMEIFSSTMDTIWTPVRQEPKNQEHQKTAFLDDKMTEWRGTQAAEGAGLLNL